MENDHIHTNIETHNIYLTKRHNTSIQKKKKPQHYSVTLVSRLVTGN